MTDDLVLSVRSATCRRGTGPDAFVLEVPSFDLRRGTCVALTGASGSGKSTMLDLLGLVLRPEYLGAFSIAGKDESADVAWLWRRDDDDGLATLRGQSIGYVLQTGGLLPFLSAGENIQLSPRLLGIPADAAWIDELVTRLSIQNTLRRKPLNLSMGERQRVAIARALAHRPPIVLADEPTAALDPTQAVTVMRLLLTLVRQAGISAVVVSHDWRLIDSLGIEAVPAQLRASGDGFGTRFVH